jgi:hypothetical protein
VTLRARFLWAVFTLAREVHAPGAGRITVAVTGCVWAELDAVVRAMRESGTVVQAMEFPRQWSESNQPKATKGVAHTRAMPHP